MFLDHLVIPSQSLRQKVLINQIKGMELGNTTDYQNAKNRRRLIQQNTRLRHQVDLIHSQITSFEGTAPIQEELSENPHQPLLQELAMQERLMRQLRARIEGFRLQRAKDNVEYIIHEQDDLKIAKQVCAKLVDQRDVLARRKADKHERLQTNLPYQNYQKQFLEGLTEVVHHNREQAAQVTEIEREIRKYHLIVKNGRSNASQANFPHSPEDVHALQKQISDKIEQKKTLERQWKPHLDQLDQQYAKLLKELATKKQAAAQFEREDRNWETRMHTVREPNEVANDKKRVNQIVVNQKLKQQMEEYLLKQQEKKKKKVNNEELKYQFKSNKQEQDKQEKVKKPEGAVAAAMAKKKQEKIIETMHDDKNISKKVQKLKDAPKKTKVDQMLNTDVSVPINKNTKDGDSAMNSSKQKNVGQQRNVRHWQANPEFNKKEKTLSKEASAKDAKNNILRLKEISISTQARHWSPQQQ